jgi:hypothetical protein
LSAKPVFPNLKHGTIRDFDLLLGLSFIGKNACTR